jgi:6-phosphogluconate dehydrogenase
MLRALGIIVFLATCLSSSVVAQVSAAVSNGTLIIDGGGTTKPVVEKFVALAGGSKARIVVIPTGVSALKFGPTNGPGMLPDTASRE